MPPTWLAIRISIGNWNDASCRATAAAYKWAKDGAGRTFVSVVESLMAVPFLQQREAESRLRRSMYYVLMELPHHHRFFGTALWEVCRYTNASNTPCPMQ